MKMNNNVDARYSILCIGKLLSDFMSYNMLILLKIYTFRENWLFHVAIVFVRYLFLFRLKYRKFWIVKTSIKKKVRMSSFKSITASSICKGIEIKRNWCKVRYSLRCSSLHFNLLLVWLNSKIIKWKIKLLQSTIVFC